MERTWNLLGDPGAGRHRCWVEPGQSTYQRGMTMVGARWRCGLGVAEWTAWALTSRLEPGAQHQGRPRGPHSRGGPGAQGTNGDPQAKPGDKGGRAPVQSRQKTNRPTQQQTLAWSQGMGQAELQWSTVQGTSQTSHPVADTMRIQQPCVDSSLLPSTPGNTASPAHTLRQRLNYLQKTAPNCGIGLRLQGWRKPGIPPHSGTGAYWKAPSISSNLPYSTQRTVGTLVTLLPDTSSSVVCRKRLTGTLGPGEVFIMVSIVHGAESKVWGWNVSSTVKKHRVQTYKRETSLVVQWLRPCASNAGGLGSTPGQGTYSHMLQLKIPQAAMKTEILHATTKMQCSQINK